MCGNDGSMLLWVEVIARQIYNKINGLIQTYLFIEKCQLKETFSVAEHKALFSSRFYVTLITIYK